jgi:AraC-like DNA-binding protein
MIFRSYQPVFPLGHFIENLLYFEGLSTPHHFERFLPDGNTELIISLTEIAQSIYDNETLQEIQTCRDAWVSGVRTRPITIPSGTGSRMLIVEFKRGRAHPFYRFPMNEIGDIVVEAHLVFGRRFCDLRDRLLAEPCVDRIFQLVERFLLQQAHDSVQENDATQCIEYAVSRMVSHPTLRYLPQLSNEIGYSQKHFIDLFRQQVGVTPKQYLKIMRFQRAVHAIECSPIIRWSGIAQECGYFDQAHLIHDFKFFSGFTPSEYLNRKADTLNYVPIK